MRNIETFPSKQMYPYLSLVERKVAEFYHNIDRRSWLVWVKMTYFHRFFRTIPGVLEQPFPKKVRNYFLMSKESSQVSEWMFFIESKRVDASPLIIKKYQLITYNKCKQQTSTRRWHSSSLICCRSNWTERVLGRGALSTVVPAKFESTLLPF